MLLRVFDPGLIPILLIAISLLGTSGCYSGELGESCADDNECKIGLGCILLDDLAGGLCTARCDDESCPEGACIQTTEGELCLEECTVGSCSSDEARCQLPPSGDAQVCWIQAEGFELVEGERSFVDEEGSLFISDVSLQHEENDDGVISPGEEVNLEIQVTNQNSRDYQGLWLEILDFSPLEVSSCYSLNSYISGSTQGCSNETRPLNLVSGQRQDNILRVGLKAPSELTPGTYSFPAYFKNDIGQIAQSALSFDVKLADVEILAHDLKIISDENGDLKASPGEEVSLGLPLANLGSARALALRLQLDSVAGVSPESCYINNSYCGSSSSGGCNCLESSSSIDLVPGLLAEDFLKYNVELAEDIEAEALAFPLTLVDKFERTWSLETTLEVVPNPASLSVGHFVTKIDDSESALQAGGDGKIEIYLQNQGSATAVNVWAEAQEPSTHLSFDSCYRLGSYCPACVCDRSSDTLAASSEQDAPAITINVEALSAGTVSIPIVIHDGFGSTWTDSITVEVQ